jgi:glycosyltransferase involved in cell wall biosynthesis
VSAAAPVTSPQDERLPQRVDWADLSVVIPAYNEQRGIVATLEALRRECPEAEVLVIDDGSADLTALRARGVPGVKVISHAMNRGYGGAIKTGVRNASRRCVAWYDADGQHRPQDLLAVAAPVVAGLEDVVIGVRGRDSAVQRDRVAGKWVLALAARWISREDIPDLNSGLRCFRTEVIRRYLHLLPDGFSASTTSTLMVMKRGYRVGYAPIRVHPRVGTSTVRIVADGLRTLQLITRIVVLFEAFRVFTTLGALLFVPGVLYSIVWATFVGQGVPTLGAMMVITGVFTFFMGILADQIAELRKERFEDGALHVQHDAAPLASRADIPPRSK